MNGAVTDDAALEGAHVFDSKRDVGGERRRGGLEANVAERLGQQRHQRPEDRSTNVELPVEAKARQVDRGIDGQRRHRTNHLEVAGAGREVSCGDGHLPITQLQRRSVRSVAELQARGAQRAAQPPKGRASFFVGGLMRAAIQRAAGEIDEPQFSIWVRHIANMQNELVADGALILKYFLHTPAKEQKKKLKKA
jgi:hypothetical protein